jgi:hypothetical protein
MTKHYQDSPVNELEDIENELEDIENELDPSIQIDNSLLSTHITVKSTFKLVGYYIPRPSEVETLSE